MSGADLTQHIFWLSSRALGVTALVLVSLSVGLGLALASRVARRPGLPARIKRLHEATALTALVAIAAHGLVLLGDNYLRPSLADLVLPFSMANQPLWTGAGIIGGWLAAILGLSFYARRWVGPGIWRKMHRWTLAVYVLALAHTFGSGTDAGSTWLLLIIAATSLPIVFLGTLRFLPRERRGPRAAARLREPRRIPRAAHQEVLP
jgi:methionine sulfoxide reductase heme-binding subunit